MSKVAVFGDFIVDIYSFYESERISPEANVPVLIQTKEKKYSGGAGLLSNKLVEYGVDVDFYTSYKFKSELNILQLYNLFNFNEISNSVTTKERLIYKNNYIYRIDNDDIVKNDNNNLSKILKKFNQNLMNYDAVVFSDYNKGFINRKLAKEVINLCKKQNILTFLDPKPENNILDLGWNFIKPNIKEAKTISNKTKTDYVVKELNKITGAEIFLTEGKYGCTYFNGKEIYKQSTVSGGKVVDVSGCGDIALAKFISEYLNKSDIKSCLKLSMQAATKSIQNYGN